MPGRELPSASCRTRPARIRRGARLPLMPRRITRVAGDRLARMDGQETAAAEAAGERLEKLGQRLGLMDDDGAAARAQHGRHEADPTVEIAVRHGVGVGLDGIAGRRAATMRVIGRIGQHAVETLDQRAELGELAQGAGHVGLDQARPVGQLVAGDVGAGESGELRVALHQRDMRIGNAPATARPTTPTPAPTSSTRRQPLAGWMRPRRAARHRAPPDSRSAAAASAAHRRGKRRRSWAVVSRGRSRLAAPVPDQPGFEPGLASAPAGRPPHPRS